MNTKQAGGVAVSGHPPNPVLSPPVLRLYKQRDPPCSAGCNTRIRSAFIRDALAARDSGFRRKLRLMIARIRSNLPIYILAGDNDPINHHLEWLKPLVRRYRRAVLRDVTEKYYPVGATDAERNQSRRGAKGFSELVATSLCLAPEQHLPICVIE
jgi:hypothetical protein